MDVLARPEYQIVGPPRRSRWCLLKFIARTSRGNPGGPRSRAVRSRAAQTSASSSPVSDSLYSIGAAEKESGRSVCNIFLSRNRVKNFSVSRTRNRELRTE